MSGDAGFTARTKKVDDDVVFAGLEAHRIFVLFVFFVILAQAEAYRDYYQI